VTRGEKPKHQFQSHRGAGDRFKFNSGVRKASYLKKVSTENSYRKALTGAARQHRIDKDNRAKELKRQEQYEKELREARAPLPHLPHLATPSGENTCAGVMVYVHALPKYSEVSRRRRWAAEDPSVVASPQPPPPPCSVAASAAHAFEPRIRVRRGTTAG